MQTKIIQNLKRDEGLRLSPYLCLANKLTIGYGRNLDDVGISEEEAELMLINDINKCVQQLSTIPVYRTLDRIRQDVLINMCFNLGFHGLLSFLKMWRALSIYDYEKAADEMMDSKWFKQVGSRAVRLVYEMRKGVNYEG